MKLSLLALSLAALVSSGCAAENTIWWHVDSSWSPEEKAMIVHNCDLWNAVSNRPQLFTDDPDRATAKMFKKATLGKSPAGLDVHGAWYLSGHFILVLDSLSPERLQSVLLHEMGHALGLEHTEGGVMGPSTPGNPKTLDLEAVNECKRVGACH